MRLERVPASSYGCSSWSTRWIQPGQPAPAAIARLELEHLDADQVRHQVRGRGAGEILQLQQLVDQAGADRALQLELVTSTRCGPGDRTRPRRRRACRHGIWLPGAGLPVAPGLEVKSTRCARRPLNSRKKPEASVETTCRKGAWF
jgi:hypothetical protein